MKIFGNSGGKKKTDRTYYSRTDAYYNDEAYGQFEQDYVTRSDYARPQQRPASQTRPYSDQTQARPAGTPRPYSGQAQQRASTAPQHYSSQAQPRAASAPQHYSSQPQQRPASMSRPYGSQAQQRPVSQADPYAAARPTAPRTSAQPQQVNGQRQAAYPGAQSARPNQPAPRPQTAPSAQGRPIQYPQGGLGSQPRRSVGDDTRAYRPAARQSGGHIPPYSKAAAKYAGFKEYEPFRTEADKRRIEAMIAAYQKKKLIRRIIILVILVALAVTGVLLWKSWVKPPDVVEPPSTNQGDATKPPKTPGEADATSAPGSLYRKEGVYTFLVVGNDDGNGNTDTMLVGAFDTVNHKLNIVSIPRDTLVNVSWNVKKVNTVLAYTDMDGLKEELSRIMGFQVDSYGVIDLKAFVALVDSVDGVDFDVPVNMHYHDPAQNLYIDIAAGYQHLTGEQAVKVVRFRSGYASADIGRIKTQQAFMKALAAKCLRLENLVKNAATYAEIFKTYVDTDLTLGNLIWYLQQFAKLNEEDINFYMLPGNTADSVKGVSYVSIYPDEWVEMINTYLNPLKEDIQVAQLGIMAHGSNGLYMTDGSEMYTNFASAPGWSEGNNSTEPTTEPTGEPTTEPTTEPTGEPTTEPSPGEEGDPPTVDPNPSTGVEDPPPGPEGGGDAGSEGNE